MKKIFTLLAFAFIFLGFKAASQTVSDCNATFTYKISGDTVQFIPAAGTDSSFIYHHWSFGDTSTLLFAYAPTHIYPGPGTYIVTQYIAKTGSNSGSPSCSDSSKDTIIIVNDSCNIIPSFTWRVDTLTGTVYFTNTTFAPSTLAVPSIWFFGDDSSSTAWSATHTYIKPGTYYVCLRLQPSANCVKYQCDSVTIPAPACNTKAGYTWKVDSLKANTIDFTNTTILPPTLNPLPVGYSIWIFGDGSAPDSSFNATHTYTQPGKYYVCLRVQTGTNCLSYQCDSITVPSPIVCNLQAYFNDLPDSLQYNKIHFTDYTTNLASTDSSYWIFGDSTSSRDVNPIHVYANPGTYNVCLTIKRITTPGTAPCVSTFCRTVTITSPTCKLLVNYSYTSDSAVTTPYTYQFTNLSSSLNTIDSIYWVFGDGTSSNDVNPVHTFAQPGTYTVCLYIKTVTPAGTVSCSGDTCKKITITTPCDFKIGYTWALDSLNKNEVFFTNTSTADTASSVRWSYSDGSPLDSTWNARHVFVQPGTYYVCLRIQTNPTCVKYQCDSIIVPPPVVTNCPKLSLYTYLVSDSNSQYFKFIPVYPATNVQYTWTFGDNDGSQLITTSHFYANPGIYTACLTAYRDSNCASTTCKEITVIPMVNCDSIAISFNYYQNGSEPNMVYFYSTLNLPLIQQSWNIANMSDTSHSPIIIYGTNPVYVFTDTGYYNVCMQGTTIGGCIKQYCRTIHITSISSPCELYAYPNPAHTQVTLNVQLNTPEMIHAYIYTSQNVLVSQTEQQGNSGNNIVTINTANFAAGFYTIKLNYGSRTCYAKFQKL